MKLSLLGGFELSTGAGPVRVARKKAQALLAYLASPAGQTHPRDKLAALLWPEVPDAQARRSLRQALFALRTTLGPARSALRLDDDAVALERGALDVDVASFERLLGDGSPAALAAAAALYKGDFLADLGVVEAAFEEWLVTERERLRELALEGLARLLADQSRAGDLAGAVRTATQLLAIDPLQEAVHRTLMALYARQGRRDAALRQYQACLAALQRDLNLEPDAETQRLYKDVLTQRPVPGTPSLAKGWDIGEVELPLIGRAREIGALRASLDSAFGGRGQAWIVVGEAGIGKSRLLQEVGHEAAVLGRLVLVGRASVAQQTLPFGLWLDAFRTARVLDDEEVRQSIDPRWRAELGRLFHELRTEAPASPPDGEGALFEAIAHLLQTLAAAAPVTLLLEDLHWADETSVRLLSFIARRCRTLPVLIVASTRPEEMTDRSILRSVLREEPISRLTLEPLPLDATTALVRALVRTGTADEGQLASQIWRASGGSPLVIVETMRALADGTAPAREGALPVADRVRDLVQARLELLGGAARTLAALSAVMRHDFEFDLLLRASGLDERTVVEGVEELVRRRLLRVIGERFDFVHDLIREATYAELLPSRRRLLHRAVAEALEGLHGRESDEHAALLGHHYLAAQSWAKAVACLERAGVQAMRRSAYRAAGAAFREALDALAHLPDDRETMQLGIDLRLKLMASNVPFQELNPLREELHREAEHLAARLGDEQRLTSILVGRMYDHWLKGDYTGGLDVGRRALTLAEARGDARVARDVRILLTRMLYASGRYRDVVTELRPLADAGGEQDVPGPTSAMLVSTRVAYYLARSLLEVGAVEEARAHAERALRRSQALKHEYSVSFDSRTLAIIHLRQGHVDLAVPLIERSVELNAKGQYGLVAELDGRAQLAVAYLASGRVAEAIDVVQPLRTAAESWQSLLRLALVATLLEAGDLDEARRVNDQVIGTARRHGQRGALAWAQKIAGDIALRRSHPDAGSADAYYREAVSLAEELGMRAVVAHCHLGLGEAAMRRGRREASAEHVQTAVTLLRDMHMPYAERRTPAIYPV